MKRILCLTLTLLMTLSALLILPACSGKNKLPADFVKGDAIVIDNETPFVYAPETDVEITIDGYKWNVRFFANACCYPTDDTAYRYQSISNRFGNKIVRELKTEEETLYYTVYSQKDNGLLYVYFEKDGDEYICSGCYPTDGRMDAEMKDRVYPQDLPTAILGDKLPSYCYLDYYTREEIERRSNLQWESYSSGCDRAGVTSDPFVSDFYCQLYAEGRHKEVEGAIRCIQDVSFDTVVEDPEDEDYTVRHGAYFYDIYVFTDGTGILFFTHFNADAYPRYTAWQKEEFSLSVTEVAKLQALLDDWEFNSIPTWNPEEFSGFDGETTTVFTKGLGHDNLTSMWSASERDAVYHIREAIEEIVRGHVTVEQGRIYRPDLYEEYEWMQD